MYKSTPKVHRIQNEKKLDELGNIGYLEKLHSLKQIKGLKSGQIASTVVKAVKKTQVTKGKQRMMKAGAIGIVLGVPTITLSAIAIKKHLSKSKTKSKSSTGSESKLPSDGSVLTPGNATSSILSNDASGHHSGTQPGNNETTSTATLPCKPEATHVHKVSYSVTKHSSLNIKHAHRSKKTTIVYIVVIVATTLLLITAGVFVLKIQHLKTKKRKFIY